MKRHLSTTLVLGGCLGLALGCKAAGAGGSGGGQAEGGWNATGGNGSGGITASGGSSATGGSGSGGSAATGGNDAASGNCTFDVSGAPSSKISTVGIITWSTTLAAPTAAQIDFGLDTSYGMTAPVDLGVANYRTL